MSFKYIFLSFFVFATFLNAAPIWFYKIASKDYEIIGYGSGKTLEEAVLQAKADVSNSIKSEIKSELNIKSSTSNDDYSHEAKSSVKSSSSSVLSGVEVIKTQKIEDEFFVAVSYDTRAFEVRFFEKIGQNKECVQNAGFLNKSPLGENLKALAKCDLKLEIYRKGNDFFIQSAGVSMPFTEDNIEKLFVEQVNLDIELNASKNSLKDGEAFHLIVKSNKTDGYISLFNLYDKGQVVLLVDNIESGFKKTIKIPQIIDENLELIASTNGKNSTKDLYIVLWHKTKLPFTLFTMVEDSALDEKKGQNLDELIKLLDKHSWSSTLVRVRK